MVNMMGELFYVGASPAEINKMDYFEMKDWVELYKKVDTAQAKAMKKARQDAQGK